MTFTNEFVLQLVVALGSAYAVYAGIKEDLAKLHERATTAKESADKAHTRIDDILNKE